MIASYYVCPEELLMIKKVIADNYRKIFHAYDIRGEAGKDLSSPIIRAIARAYADYLCPDKAGKFVIGYDARWSSPAFAEAMSVGLREAGHHVTQIGLSSTPLVYWYGAEGGFDGSVAITASHLPPEYNGLKLCRSDAVPLSSEDGLNDILDTLLTVSDRSMRQSNELLTYISPLSLYADCLKKHLKPVRRLRIAVDAGNGMGGAETEAVFSCCDMVEIWPIGFHPDARFSTRPSNPLEEGALAQLCQVVLKNNLSFGIAFDGDADRAVVIDERGELVSAEVLGGLIARYLLSEHPGATILHDLRISRAFTEEVQGSGARTVRSRVGHAFIKLAMRKHDAIFAAELSGHYYYADLHFTDNGLRTLIELVNILSREDRPLSALARPFQKYPTTREISIKIDDWGKVRNRLAQDYYDGQIDYLDGISVDYPDWWFNVRPSNTEPVVRINIGAISNRILAAKRISLLEQIKKY